MAEVRGNALKEYIQTLLLERFAIASCITIEAQEDPEAKEAMLKQLAADRKQALLDCMTQVVMGTPADSVPSEKEKKTASVNRRQAKSPELLYADTERKRQQLFKQVQSGRVRVLLGSTFKLGLGVNVQDKLIAVHHLDVPWRPADMTQREGRILRQGNENAKVQIFRYITEGSFDAYSWQLLETKQRFIVDLLSGSLESRSGSDIEDTVLDAQSFGKPSLAHRNT